MGRGKCEHICESHPSLLSLWVRPGVLCLQGTTVEGCNSGKSPLVCFLANSTVIFISFHLYPKVALPRCHTHTHTNVKVPAKLHQNERKYMFVIESLGERSPFGFGISLLWIKVECHSGEKTPPILGMVARGQNHRCPRNGRGGFLHKKRSDTSAHVPEEELQNMPTSGEHSCVTQTCAGDKKHEPDRKTSPEGLVCCC